jgi:hypothetical protein
MPASIDVTSTGTSPIFEITAEEFKLVESSVVTPLRGDWVPSPALGANGGVSQAMLLTNQWFPWIDEKLVMAKFDGICQYFGIISNRPTFIKDYHIITLMRATDRLLAPMYQGIIFASVTTPAPGPPPTV